MTLPHSPGVFAETSGWDYFAHHMRRNAEVPSGSNRGSDDPMGMPRFRAAEEEPEEASILLHSYNNGRMKQHSHRTQAVVAVFRRGDRLLVIKRASGVILPGYWTPPSGRIEPGETHEQALIREVEEELGVKATPIAKVWECPTDDGEFLLHWWTADIDSHALRLDPTEVADARWVTCEEFLELEPTFSGDRDFIAHVLPTLAPTGSEPEEQRPQ
jgi:8-oxo-dGTP diphosphatase